MDDLNLGKILLDIKKAKVGIIGDFCLDVYWHINDAKSEISIETSLATRTVETQKYSLGGAGNVANNLQAMGVVQIHVFGAVGNDPFAGQMKKLMDDVNINHEGLICQNELWSTHVYIKPICNGEEENRIDFGNFNVLNDKTVDSLLCALDDKASYLDIIIINQQVIDGIHSSEYFRNRLQKLINSYPETKFILDSRDMCDEYTNTMHKINDLEATILCGYDYTHEDLIPLADVHKSLDILYDKWNKPLFVTRGARGCLVHDSSGVSEVPGLHIISKVDTVGAGDSMLSGIAACIAAGYTAETAAAFGNFVAGVTVQKLYVTGTASPDEIFDIGNNPDYIYRTEKADDSRRAVYYNNSEIEIVSENLSEIKLTHVIFDHDGTISTLREGWENIMEPMMIKAILGDKYSSADETTFHRVLNRVQKFISDTTGIQTINQMQGFVNIIKEFGFVPSEEILDKYGYKKLYNEELLNMVTGRINKLNRNELNVNDFTINGVIKFLKKLYDNNMKLYMASGSDEQDVIKEAELLGYAHYFEGKIYGASDSNLHEVKKVVMDRILNDIGSENSSGIAAIGDGPVEIREIKKHGGIGIGIASDELRRFGPNQTKRSRLIKAGADIIINDYTQFEKLVNLFNL